MVQWCNPVCITEGVWDKHHHNCPPSSLGCRRRMIDCTVDQEDNKDAVWGPRYDGIVQAHRLWPEQDRTLNLAYLFPPTGCSVAAVYNPPFTSHQCSVALRTDESEGQVNAFGTWSSSLTHPRRKWRECLIIAISYGNSISGRNYWVSIDRCFNCLIFGILSSVHPFFHSFLHSVTFFLKIQLLNCVVFACVCVCLFWCNAVSMFI